MEILVTGLNDFNNPQKNPVAKEWGALWQLITESAKGVQFPCLCKIEGYGDGNIPYVLLPNGNTLSVRYLQIAD